MAEEITLAEMYYHATEQGDDYGGTPEISFADLLKKRKKKQARQKDLTEMSGDFAPRKTPQAQGLGATTVITPEAPTEQEVEDTPVATPLTTLADQPVPEKLINESSPERLENLPKKAPNALEFLGEDDTRSVDIYKAGGETTLTTKDRKKIKAKYPDYSFWKNDTVEAFQKFLARQSIPAKKRYRVDDRKRGLAADIPDTQSPWISDSQAYESGGLSGSRVHDMPDSNIARENKMFQLEDAENPDINMPLRPYR